MSDLARKKENCIKVIRSLLISAPSGLTLQQLERDYQSVQNEKLPYRKFGHTDLLSFMKTMTDVVQIDFRNREIFLHGIADEKTKHIKSMVDNQRKTSRYMGLSKQIVPPRRPKSGSIAARCVGYASASVRRNIFNVVQAHDKGIPLSNFGNMYKHKNGISLNADRLGFRRFADLFLSMPDVCRLEYGRRDCTGNNLYVFPAKASEEPVTVPLLSLDTKPPLKSNATPQKQESNRAICGDAKQNIEKVCGNKTSEMLRNDKNDIKPHLKAVNDTRDKRLDNNNNFEISVPPSCQLVKNEILEILADEPKGIWAVRVPILYKKKFGKELQIQKLGYFSIIEFLATLSDQISISRPNPKGDWMLSKRSENANQQSQEIYNSYLNEGLQITKMEVKEMLIKSKDGILYDKLFETYEKIYKHKIHLDDVERSIPDSIFMALMIQGVCIYEKGGKIYITLTDEEKKAVLPSYRPHKNLGVNNIPADSVGPDYSYKLPPLPSSDTEYVDVFVSDVTTPGYFLVQLCGKKTTGALNRLMDELERFYCSPEADQYKLPPCMVTLGQICAAVFLEDMNWHRAVIVNINKASFVDVLYVDYGSIAAVSVGSLRLLKACFMHLPSQMIKARLAHIRPKNLTEWTMQSRNAMLDMCRDRPLVAMITGIEDRVLSLCLCDTSLPDKDIHINDILVEKNHAVFFPDDLSEHQANTLRTFLLQQMKLESEDLNVSSSQDVPALFSDSLESDTPAKSNFETDMPVHSQQENFAENAYNSVTLSKPPCIVPKRFIQKHQILNGKYSINVINYEGNAMVTSADISLLFQQSHGADVLVPLLLMKNLQFTELPVGNDNQHFELFRQLKDHQVPGAVDKGNARKMVCLYRLQDVPAMVNGIGHVHEREIIQDLGKIIGNFDPDSKNWITDSPEDDKPDGKNLDALIKEKKDLHHKRIILLEQLGTETSARTVDDISAIEAKIRSVEADIKECSATNPKQLSVDDDVSSVHSVMMNHQRSTHLEAAEKIEERKQSEEKAIVPKPVAKVAEVVPFVQNNNSDDKLDADLGEIPGAQMSHNIVDFNSNANTLASNRPSMEQPAPLVNNGNPTSTNWNPALTLNPVLNQGTQIQSGIFIPGGVSDAFQSSSLSSNRMQHQSQNRTSQPQMPVIPTHWRCVAMPSQQNIEQRGNMPQFFPQPQTPVYYNQMPRQANHGIGSQVVFTAQNGSVGVPAAQYSLFLPTSGLP